MVEGAVFIGTVIIAITQAIKYASPKVNGAVTIGIAALVGLLVALVDKEIGVVDLTVAQGILVGLSSAGVVTVAQKVNVGTLTPVDRRKIV